MATTNKSLTTYLPDRSVEWLESYCLDYKHLQNKDGKPKLGTAIADIITRLADGELALPEKTESQSTAPIQYGTEVETLKGEVEELKKLITEYGTNKLPDTVLSLEIVKNEIGIALEPIIESTIELQAYTQNQFKAVREELKKAFGVASPTENRVTPDTIARTTTPAKTADKDPSVKTWGEFFKMVGIEAITATEAQKKENIDIRTQQIEQGLKAGRERGLGEWVVKSAGRDFMRVGD